MKLENSTRSTAMTSKGSVPNLPIQQSITNGFTRTSSSASMIQRRNPSTKYSRRQTGGTLNNDLVNQHKPSTDSVPLLATAMHDFFQATKVMEDEVMLPSRLRDMPVDEMVFDNSVQPNDWHELYSFVRDMRNQLTRSHPFANDESYTKQPEIKDPNDDEGILVTAFDTNQNSSASSTVSSDELEQSTASSNLNSFNSIRDELKHHFFGLLTSLDNLKLIADTVTEKYREDSIFKS